jgi:hypothetical protein
MRAALDRRDEVLSPVRNPKEQSLKDLILLFMPSTAPRETLRLVHDRIPHPFGKAA